MDPTVSLRPHETLLLRICRQPAAAELDVAEVRQANDPVLRSALLEAAERHDVLGLVLSTLARAEVSRELPDRALETVTEPLKLLSRQSLLWDMERQRLVHVLARDGLEPVWLKGGALRGTVYRRPVERRIGDIDLLVTPEELRRTVAVLEAAGYHSQYSEEETAALTKHHFHLRLEHKAGYVTEVHWALTAPSDSFRLDPEGFLRRSRYVNPAEGLRIRAPGAEDMILHCAAQSFENAFASLRRLVDIDRVAYAAKDLDWEFLAREARRSRLNGVLAFSLQLARSTLGTQLPPDYLGALRVPRSLRLHTSLLLPARSHVRQSFKDRFAPAWLLRFWLTPNWRLRAQLVTRRFTNRDRPLRWLWHGQESAEDHDEGLLAGPWTIAKAAAYQSWLYLRSLAMLVVARGRRQLRFWS